MLCKVCIRIICTNVTRRGGRHQKPATATTIRAHTHTFVSLSIRQLWLDQTMEKVKTKKGEKKERKRKRERERHCTATTHVLAQVDQKEGYDMIWYDMIVVLVRINIFKPSHQPFGHGTPRYLLSHPYANAWPCIRPRKESGRAKKNKQVL